MLVHIFSHFRLEVLAWKCCLSKLIPIFVAKLRALIWNIH